MKNIFDYRNDLLTDFKNFSQSFVQPKAKDIIEFLNDKVYQDKYWPEPLLQINPHYYRHDSVTDLVHKNILLPECERIFRFGNTPLQLYDHQVMGITKAHNDESYILTTGTGSGKSLSFFIPIVDHIIREKKKDSTPRTRAIIMYPMNALANSQLGEINKFLENAPDIDITVRRYTGQESSEERIELANNPPDILITNYMMMELILTRYDEHIDVKVIEHAQNLKFFVMDELHTYRGRQGADVALLVRRVRDRLNAKDMICIGTSATMSSSDDDIERKSAVAKTGSIIFGTDIPASNVIEEKLVRAVAPNKTISQKQLRDRLLSAKACGRTYAELFNDILAVWVESKLSLKTTANNVDRRATPLPLSKVYEKLADDAGVSVDVARVKLNELLLAASGEEITKELGEPLFAFKLHQFLSGPGTLMTTLEDNRVITVEEQKYAPERDKDVLLYNTYFCRDCGQEFIPVYQTEHGTKYIPRSIDEKPVTTDEDEDMFWGYLVPVDEDQEYDGTDDTLPPSWVDNYDGKITVNSSHKKRVPKVVSLSAYGSVDLSGKDYYYIPGALGFCPSCGTEFNPHFTERTKVSGLSGEGRSSSTTIITLNLLKQMFEDDMDESKRKMLGFIDNRQDAALQSGHFNDFVNKIIFRCASLAALDMEREPVCLTKLLNDIFDILGFSDFENDEAQKEIFTDPNKGYNFKKRELDKAKTMLAYRLLNDLQKKWIYSNPSLYHLGLLSVSYMDFDEIENEKEQLASYPLLSQISIENLKVLFKILYDEMVGAYCINSDYLDYENLSKLRSNTTISARWGFDAEEVIKVGTKLRTITNSSKTNRTNKGMDAYDYLSCSSSSKIGKEIKKKIKEMNITLHGNRGEKTSEIISRFILELLDFSSYLGIVEKGHEKNSVTFQLNEDCILWSKGPGKSNNPKWNNDYFKNVYISVADQLMHQHHDIFNFESQEHTAQVDSVTREVLEKRFRGEPDYKPLPVLYCSPTMELGIDISSLNTVYMRNIPPTPANYAQRSGRAGRSGQAALVVTYCTARSPHDQWYFNHMSDMVGGTIVTPQIDLANKDLVESHLMAIWLASCKCSEIKSSIVDVIDRYDVDNNFPIKKEIQDKLTDPDNQIVALKGMKALTTSIKKELDAYADWYGPGFEENLLENAYDKFNHAFDSWRLLVRETQNKLDEITAKTKTGEYKNAGRIFTDLTMQLNLLMNDKTQISGVSSDFYIFRYLAGQGVVPGYNFPRLPIMAWIKHFSKDKATGEEIDIEQVPISRPRFLALSEFGPRSIIYHRGNTYQVNRVKIDPSTVSSENGCIQLNTMSVIICPNCGYGIISETGQSGTQDICPCCHKSIVNVPEIPSLYKITTVETRPYQAITSLQEERQRKGYEMQTVYSYPVAESRNKRTSEVIASDGSVLATLRYIPGATLLRINKGWKKRLNKNLLGFNINPSSGWWEKENPDDDSGDNDYDKNSPVQRIVPYAEDHKNVLILEPSNQNVPIETLATLQAAIARGIQHVFQIEDSELAVEPLPDNTNRHSLLFYEASEGGAGVLSRLANDPESLGQVAEKALEIMHYKWDKNKSDVSVDDLEDQNDQCVAGCYHCLLSYMNQQEHSIINRRDPVALSILLQLSKADFVQKEESFIPDEADCFASYCSRYGINTAGLVKDKTINTGDVIPYYNKESKHAFFFSAPEPALASYLERKGRIIYVLGTTEDDWNNHREELKYILGEEK